MAITEEAGRVTEEVDARVVRLRQYLLREGKAALGLAALGVLTASKKVWTSATNRWPGHGKAGLVKLKRLKASDAPTVGTGFALDQDDPITKDFVRLLARYHVPASIANDEKTNEKCLFFRAGDTERVQGALLEALSDHGWGVKEKDGLMRVAGGQDVGVEELSRMTGLDWSADEAGTLVATTTDDRGARLTARVPKQGEATIARTDARGAETLATIHGATPSIRAMQASGTIDAARSGEAFDRERAKARKTPDEIMRATRSAKQRSAEQAGRRRKPLVAHGAQAPSAGRGRGF